MLNLVISNFMRVVLLTFILFLGGSSNISSQGVQYNPYEIYKGFKEYYLDNEVYFNDVANDVKKFQPLIKKHKIKSISVQEISSEPPYRKDPPIIFSFSKDGFLLLKVDSIEDNSVSQTTYTYHDNKLISYCEDSLNHYTYLYNAKGRLIEITSKRLKDIVSIGIVGGIHSEIIIKADTVCKVNILYDLQDRIIQYRRICKKNDPETIGPPESFTCDYYYRDSCIEIFENKILKERLILNNKEQIIEITSFDTIHSLYKWTETLTYTDDLIQSNTKYFSPIPSVTCGLYLYKDGRKSISSEIEYKNQSSGGVQWFYEYDNKGLIQKAYKYDLRFFDITIYLYSYSYW